VTEASKPASREKNMKETVMTYGLLSTVLLPFLIVGLVLVGIVLGWI